MSGNAAIQAVKEAALDLGFLACGIAHLGPSRRGDALDRWLAAGYAGEMRYLHRQARKRRHPVEIVPGAKVAVMVLENYLPTDGRTTAATVAPLLRGRPVAPLPGGDAVRRSDGRDRQVKIAKYAQGEDYHRAMGRRLERLAGVLRAHGARIAKVYLDAGPVPERELAERAGLGWIGKNTMLLRPGVGSFFFIGTIFTDLDLLPDQPFALDRCGTCTRCLEACPTGAFVAPRILDARRCISYLTIEQKGPIPEALGERMEGWAFGCDICNDVCPWNERFAAPTRHEEYRSRVEPDVGDPTYFERLDEAAFDRRFGDTPLERPGLVGMRRNWIAARRSR